MVPIEKLDLSDRGGANSILELEVPPSHALVFYYAPLAHVKLALRAGIPALKRGGVKGVIVSLQRPSTLSEHDAHELDKLHGGRDAVICCSLPRHLLYPLPHAPDSSSLRYIPHDIIEAFISPSPQLAAVARRKQHGEAQGVFVSAVDLSILPDPGPWLDGQLLLPLHCVLRAFRISAPAWYNLRAPSKPEVNDLSIVYSDLKNGATKSRVVTSAGQQQLCIKFDHECELVDLTPQNVVNAMGSVRSFCSQRDLVPLYVPCFSLS
jgi:hypothetical protein